MEKEWFEYPKEEQTKEYYKAIERAMDFYRNPKI